MKKFKQPKNKVTFVISTILILFIAISVLYIIYRGITGLHYQTQDEELKETAQVQAREIILELQAQESNEKIDGPVKKGDVVLARVVNVYGDNVDKQTSNNRIIVSEAAGLTPELVNKFIGKDVGDTFIYERRVIGKNYDSVTSKIQINGIFKLAPMNEKMVAEYVKNASKGISDQDLLKQLMKVKTPEQLQTFLENFIFKSFKEQEQAPS